MVARRASAFLAAAVSVLLLAGAADAGAETFKAGPLRYSTASLGYGPGGTGTVPATCPGTSRIAAVGGSVASSTPTVGLSNLRVTGTRDGAVSTGYNDGSQPTTQRTTAVCLARGGSALSYATDNGTSATGGSSTAGGTNCAAGRLVSGAFETAGEIGAVQLEELTPGLTGREPDRDTLAWGFSKAATPSALDYEATAICLPATAGKLRYAYRARVAFGDEVTTIRTPCPKGTRAIGGGTGRFPFHLQASQPYDGGDRGRVPDDGWMSRTYSSSSGAVITHAVCLRG